MTDTEHKYAFLRGDVIILLILCFVNLSLSLDKQALSVVAPIMQSEFNLTLLEITLVISAMSWAYSAAQLPSGWLTEKVGARTLLVVATAAWGIVTMLTPFASGFASLILLRVLLGLGQAPDWIASVYVLSRRFGDGQRSTATSILLSANYLGLVIGGPISLWLLKTFHWQANFYIYGAAGVVMAVICFFTPGLDVAGTDAEKKERAKVKAPIKAILTSSQVWAICFVYYAMVTLFGFFWAMLPIYLKSARHIDLHDMSWLISVPYIFLWVGVLATGRVSDRIMTKSGSKWHARVPLGTTGLLIGAIGMGCMVIAPTPMLIGASLCVALLGIGFVGNTIWSTVQDVGASFAGILSGWVSFCGHLASGTSLVAISVLVERTGSWEVALLLPIGIGLAGACAWLTIRPDTTVAEAVDSNKPVSAPHTA